jgi:cell division FtsZ-interacting protein ZapD
MAAIEKCRAIRFGRQVYRRRWLAKIRAHPTIEGGAAAFDD